MAARRIYRANRRTIDGKAVEHRHQSPGAEIVADEEGREPSDAKTCQRGISQCLRVGRTKSAADRDRTNLFVDVEAPLDRPAAVNECEAAMLRQLFDILRRASACQIGRGRAGDEA